MAITLQTNARNASVTAVTGLLDAGTIEIQSSTDVVLAVLTFGATAFGAPATGVATANPITRDESANASGTATKFVVKNSAAAAVFAGTVGTSAADLIVSTTSVTAGQPFEINSFTYTQPAAA